MSSFDSASCLPTGLLPKLSRRDGFRLMWLLPLVSVACVLLIGISLPASHLMLGIALAIASVTDIGRRKIYNWTTYPLVVSGWAFAGLTTAANELSIQTPWLGSVDLANSLTGTIVCGAITFVAYAASRGGAGDVKLAAGVGSVLGPELGLAVIATAYILAASFVLTTTTLDGSVGRLLCGLVRSFGNRITAFCPPVTDGQQAELRRTIPLAGFFALGALFWALWLS